MKPSLIAVTGAKFLLFESGGGYQQTTAEFRERVKLFERVEMTIGDWIRNFEVNSE